MKPAADLCVRERVCNMSMTTTEPAAGFSAFNFNAAIRRAIEEAGYVSPRPIQEQTIPAALEGRDILGLAQTGTGKTAAFALPILERLFRQPARGPRILVVAPTRELANQISEDFRDLGRFLKVRVATLFGGVSANKQISALRGNPDIIVACPGRLLDLHGQGVVPLDRIETLVLDEADHMFDMGFLPDIRRILRTLPADRQTMLFSATMPSEIRSLAENTLRQPHRVELAHSQPANTIDHSLYSVDEGRKFDLLSHLLTDDTFVSAIVFTRTKHRAKRLSQKLIKQGVNAVALQGNMSQNARERAMSGFKARQFDVLVATDIAARGLDIQQVSHVINFDMPTTPDAYTHRIGRTGRAERSGRAFTFTTVNDWQMVRAVERRIGKTIGRVVVPGYEPTDRPNLTPDTPNRHRSPGHNPGRSQGNRPRSPRPGGGGGTAASSSRSTGGEGTSATPTRRRRRRRPQGTSPR
jgi:ATP-dependent RNA helicase RhlE